MRGGPKPCRSRRARAGSAAWRRAAVAVAAWLVAGALIPAAAAAKPLPCFYANGAQETLVSGMTIHPAAVRHGDKTWIAFQGPGYDPYVAEWDSSARRWAGPFRVGGNALVLDAHGAPALWVDGTGRLHVFWGEHGGALRHAVTATPGSIDRWMTMPDAAAHATYPQPLAMPGGSLTIFYRAAPDVGWVSRTSTDGGATFQTARTVLASDAHTAWYANFSAGASGRIHCAFVRQDNDRYQAGSLFSRYDLHYVYREADGSWRAPDGSALPAIPVVPETMAAPARPATADRCRVFDSGSALVNEVTVEEDDTGAPCILALVQTGPSLADFTWRWWRLSGGAWRTTDITVADHFFDAAAFSTGASGTVEAALVAGRSPLSVPLDGDHTGRGGTIERWLSADRGVTWTRGDSATISPDEPGVGFSDPVMVRGASAGDRIVFADWTNDYSDFWRRLYLWGDGGLVPKETSGTSERMFGTDRCGTAAAVSKRAFPEGARAIVVATDRDFPDALAGAPLAARLCGPMLLTRPGGLPAAVQAEIRRLAPDRAVVLGTRDVVSDGVVTQLRGLGVARVERIGGATRYDTMLAIDRSLRGPANRVHTAVVVSGRSWPDAAAAAPLAAANGWPIILTDPGRLAPQASSALALWGITRTIVVGGRGSVSDSVFARLPAAVRIGGVDRCDTAARLAEWGLREGLVPDRAMVASADSFADALSAADLGHHARAPLLLTRSSSLATPTAGYLRDHADRIGAAFAIGGGAALGSRVWNEARREASVQ